MWNTKLLFYLRLLFCMAVNIYIFLIVWEESMYTDDVREHSCEENI
jgi:hypothetical protein